MAAPDELGCDPLTQILASAPLSDPSGNIQDGIDDGIYASSLRPSEGTGMSITSDHDLNPAGDSIESDVLNTFNCPYEIFLPFTTVALTKLDLRTSVQMREEE